MLSTYKNHFADTLTTHIPLKREQLIALIERPPENIPGDLAFPCFQLAKELKKAPQQIAADIANQLQSDFFSSFENIGPYINAHINITPFATATLENILKQQDNYGKGEPKQTTILIEWRSPNTHKTVHIGHLRNALVSESMCTIAERAGYDVIRSAYGWDIGAHVAKRIWYYKSFAQGDIPQDSDTFCIRSGKIYAEATKKVGENPKEYKQQIHEVQRLLESGDPELTQLRKETRELSIKGLQNIFTELWCTVGRYYRESEVEQPGIELVKQYVDNPDIPDIKHSQWAIIADLEKYDLGIFVLLKSNGTSLYSTKDIALAYLKEKEYNFDMSLYVVATEQNHHFKQLFKTLELVGYDTSKLIHMGYELVELPTGKMSSRAGTIIQYHTRRDNTVQQAYELVKERSIENKQKVAKEVAFAALKFSMLLQDTYKKIRLDMDKSLSFEGETWPYLQYSYARCCAILAKKSATEWNIDYTLLQTPEEKELIIQLSMLPNTTQKASDQKKPSLIARYTLELCRSFNSFYSKNTIIGGEEDIEQARLTLVQATAHTIKKRPHYPVNSHARKNVTTILHR